MSQVESESQREEDNFLYFVIVLLLLSSALTMVVLCYVRNAQSVRDSRSVIIPASLVRKE